LSRTENPCVECSIHSCHFLLREYRGRARQRPRTLGRGVTNFGVLSGQAHPLMSGPNVCRFVCDLSQTQMNLQNNQDAAERRKALSHKAQRYSAQLREKWSDGFVISRSAVRIRAPAFSFSLQNQEVRVLHALLFGELAQDRCDRVIARAPPLVRNGPAHGGASGSLPQVPLETRGQNQERRPNSASRAYVTAVLAERMWADGRCRADEMIEEIAAFEFPHCWRVTVGKPPSPPQPGAVCGHLVEESPMTFTCTRCTCP
jgi:hypothetical protein